MNLNDERLSLIKKGLNAKQVYGDLTKLIHKYDCFQIYELVVDGTKVINVRLKVKHINLKPHSLELKQLISDLIILSEALDR